MKMETNGVFSNTLIARSFKLADWLPKKKKKRKTTEIFCKISPYAQKKGGKLNIFFFITFLDTTGLSSATLTLF